MDLIFASLKNITKHGLNFLQAEKSSKNIDLIFASLKKLKRHGNEAGRYFRWEKSGGRWKRKNGNVTYIIGPARRFALAKLERL